MYAPSSTGLKRAGRTRLPVVEIEGHPRQDLLEELERRGAVLVDGSSSGANVRALRFISERLGETAGSWLFLPADAVFRGFEDR